MRAYASLLMALLVLASPGMGVAAEGTAKASGDESLFDFNRLAVSASGRAYHPLLFGKWDKKDGTALQYEVKGEKYLAFKPTVGKSADGDTWVAAKVGRFRAHVMDDVADIRIVSAPSGVVKFVTVRMTMLKREPFESGSVAPTSNADRKAATASVVSQITKQLEAYLESEGARKGRKYLSVVVPRYLKALLESVRDAK